MFLKNILLFIFVLVGYYASSQAMIVENNALKPKAVLVRKYLKEIDLMAMSKDVLNEDRDRLLEPLIVRTVDQIKNLDILNKFEPFLQDKLPKKNTVNQNKLNALIDEMSQFLKLYFTLFNCLETCRAENIMFSLKDAKYPLELIVSRPDNFIALEDFRKAYETTDLRDRFLRFQYVSNFFCNLLSSYGLLDRSQFFGSLSSTTQISIGYIKDNGGFVLFPLEKESNEKIILPFGEALNNNSRIVVHSKGKIEQNHGIMALHTGDNLRPLQLGYYSGSRPNMAFTDSDMHFYYSIAALNNPNDIMDPKHKILAKALFPEIEINELNQTRCKFFPLPATPLEQKLLDYIILEDIINNKDDNNALKFIELALETDEVNLNEVLKHHQDIELELLELAEQELNAELLELSKINNNNISQKNNKKTIQSSASQLKLRSEAEKRVNILKVEGRQKWRHILRLVNEIRKEYPNLSKANLNISGSHITFHAPNNPSITIVPKHGKKDLTVGASRVNSFVSKLINFAMTSEKF